MYYQSLNLAYMSFCNVPVGKHAIKCIYLFSTHDTLIRCTSIQKIRKPSNLKVFRSK